MTAPRSHAAAGLGAIILAGGASTRMGRPKAWLPHRGFPGTFLQFVVAELSQVTRIVVVVRSAGQPLPALPQHVCVTEDLIPQAGPAAGLVAGLSALPGPVPAAFLTGCDFPNLTAASAREIMNIWVNVASKNRNAHMTPIALRDGAFWNPMFAVYPRDATTIRNLNSDGRSRSLQHWLTAARAIPHSLDTARSQFAVLRNINTPEEYHQWFAEPTG